MTNGCAQEIYDEDNKQSDALSGQDADKRREVHVNALCERNVDLEDCEETAASKQAIASR